MKSIFVKIVPERPLAIRRHWAYFKYVMGHKWHVYRAGRLLGVPVLQLIVHDWSKFLPSEWFPYAECFYEADGSKRYKETVRFMRAWNQHQKLHKHHYQYWQLRWDRAETENLEIPANHLLEMVADWSGAGRVIAGTSNPINWVQQNLDKLRKELHPESFSFMMAIVANADWSMLK